MQYFYHYTSEQRLRGIVDGGDYGRNGLIPLRRVVALGLSERFNLPEKAEQGAVYGLLEPAPSSWLTHEYHQGQGLLETVLHDAISGSNDKMYLLKCRVEEGDDIYVADHVFHMRPDYNGRNDLQNPATAEVKNLYWNSMVKFHDYKGQHDVPEVICFSQIPLERIKIDRVYESGWHLLNELRMSAGRTPLPPRPVPNYASLFRKPA